MSQAGLHWAVAGQVLLALSQAAEVGWTQAENISHSIVEWNDLLTGISVYILLPNQIAFPDKHELHWQTFFVKSFFVRRIDNGTWWQNGRRDWRAKLDRRSNKTFNYKKYGWMKSYPKANKQKAKSHLQSNLLHQNDFLHFSALAFCSIIMLSFSSPSFSLRNPAMQQWSNVCPGSSRVVFPHSLQGSPGQLSVPAIRRQRM